MNEGIRRLATAGRLSGRPRVGTVVSIDADLCTVLVSEGEVPAYLTDQVLNDAVIGAVVTLLPVGDTYEVIATRTGTAGSGGLILGPELIPNSGFEYGTDVPTNWAWWPWASGSYAASRDTTPGSMVSGAARALVTLKPDPVDDPNVNVWTTPAIRVDPGIAYQGAVWVKASAITPTLVVDLNLISAPTADAAGPFGAGAITTTAATIASPGGAYQLLTGPVTIPAGHHYARVFLHAIADNAIAAPVDVSWDEASLRQRITS